MKGVSHRRGHSLPIPDKLKGTNTFKVTVVVLKMDTQEELDHNEAKVYPKGGATTELEISLTVAENPEK